MIEITARCTFLAPTPPEHVFEHLYIVIAIIGEDKALLVNVTTQRDNSDNACILRVGDHDFIKHDSVINYMDTGIIQVSKLKEKVGKREFILKPPVSSELFKRIKEGAKDSLYLPPRYLNYFSV